MTVNLNQHGTELLEQLDASQLSVLAVEQAATQLDSIAPPNPVASKPLTILRSNGSFFRFSSGMDG